MGLVALGLARHVLRSRRFQEGVAVTAIAIGALRGIGQENRASTMARLSAWNKRQVQHLERQAERQVQRLERQAERQVQRLERQAERQVQRLERQAERQVQRLERQANRPARAVKGAGQMARSGPVTMAAGGDAVAGEGRRA
jgi:flagellar biosynthesis GTPase FlhF